MSMINPTLGVGEFSPIQPQTGVRRASEASTMEVGPSDQVSLQQGAAKGIQGDDQVSKSSSSHRSHKTHKASEMKETPMAKFDKASEKFLDSVVTLRGCSEADEQALGNAIASTEKMEDLDSNQKLFVVAQGLGRYAADELTKMANSAPEQAQEKRWDALCNVIQTAHTMVDAFPATNSPQPASPDFNAGVPGSHLLGSSPTRSTDAPPQASAPAGGASQSKNPLPPGGPVPPSDPNDQAAMDDYNQAMKIYEDIVAARQKNMADMLKIQQDTQTAILGIVSNIWSGWAKVVQDRIDQFNRYLSYNGNPKCW